MVIYTIKDIIGLCILFILIFGLSFLLIASKVINWLERKKWTPKQPNPSGGDEKNSII